MLSLVSSSTTKPWTVVLALVMTVTVVQASFYWMPDVSIIMNVLRATRMWFNVIQLEELAPIWCPITNASVLMVAKWHLGTIPTLLVSNWTVIKDILRLMVPVSILMNVLWVSTNVLFSILVLFASITLVATVAVDVKDAQDLSEANQFKKKIEVVKIVKKVKRAFYTNFLYWLFILTFYTDFLYWLFDSINTQN